MVVPAKAGIAVTITIAATISGRSLCILTPSNIFFVRLRVSVGFGPSRRHYKLARAAISIVAEG
ncbi:hypothetical protein, partial [Agrobacterium sp. MCAB5]|uniref:hypothetical protein n=1 Tax=Agrobacterium sp. MCAB5 TaxID=3233042 RepID=UPI003F8E93DD